jgi:hypothetical protein
MVAHRLSNVPDFRVSRHSKVISNWYESPNLAGLFRMLTPKRDTTDILLMDNGARNCDTSVGVVESKCVRGRVFVCMVNPRRSMGDG